MAAGARQYVVLTRLALTELARQPVCFLITLTCVALSTALPLLTAHQLGQQSGLARDGALAFEFVGGALLAAFAACSTLANEARRGTILTLLSRPLSREMLFLAKFTAVAMVVFMFVACCACAALLADRLVPRYFETDWFGVRLLLAVPVVSLVPAAVLNWRRGWSVAAWGWLFLLLSLVIVTIVLSRIDAEGHTGRVGQYIDGRLIPAAVLVGVGLLILSALALSLAAHLPLAPTVTILLVWLFAGLVSQYMARLADAWTPLAAVIRTAIPDLQAFWPADDLSGGAAFGWNSLGSAARYGFLYTFGLLCLGMAAFRYRQF